MAVGGGEGKSVQDVVRNNYHTRSSSRTQIPPENEVQPNKWKKFFLTVVIGGTAGCISKTALAPLEMVRILVQSRSPSAEDYYGKV